MPESNPLAYNGSCKLGHLKVLYDWSRIFFGLCSQTLIQTIVHLLSRKYLSQLRTLIFSEGHDTQHNDIEYDDTQNDDTQHDDSQHNYTQHNGPQYWYAVCH